MDHREGVIQFEFVLRAADAAAAADDVPQSVLADLNSVRDVLRRLGLLGRSADRYGGLGFGNLSVRTTPPAPAGSFWISGSQTGELQTLGAADVCRIDEWDTEEFRLRATGLRPPSSEALTHAMIYECDERVRWILHAHDSSIWSAAARTGLAATAPGAAYGSPAMAAAVRMLLAAHPARPLVFVTPGHEDGVFAVGDDAAAVAAALVSALVRARLQR